MRLVSVALMSAAIALNAPAQVKVWMGKLTLPVYEEGLPDVNPPFDAFSNIKYSYPYTLRTHLTGTRADKALRAVYLENEYLKCSVLPDIGGHLYSCTDKINGREMFYANPSLKKQLIGYRGAWAAFGIEFNFPVSHNWMSMSPVDFAWRNNPDGSGSVFVGNIDRPYGMQWRVELILRPRSTVLEERVTLYNRDMMRHRYYWWNNAAAEVTDDSKLYYPMRYSASHGFTYVDTWPVNHEGMDVSLIKNQTAGPVSQFVHGSREPFMGVWHPKWNSGVVHYADYADLPGKKVWSWGVDPDGLDWRKALSDNNSGYIEIQAGLFRNQETYAFLPPQSTTQFSEYWMPVREIGGISRANLNGVVFMTRDGGKLRVSLNVNRPIPAAHVRVSDGKRVLLDTRETIDPARTFTRELDNAPNGRCSFELSDGKGNILLAHTEDTYDWTPQAEIKTGQQPTVQREADPIEHGADQELNGQLLAALSTYRSALERNPDSFELNRAAGRLAVTVKDYEAGVEYLKRAQQHSSNDAEVQYYLGHGYAGLGDEAHARAQWEGAQRQPQFRAAARFALAQLAAREKRTVDALRLLREALADEPSMVRAGAAEVALLRATGDTAQARELAARCFTEDPTSSWLRYELTMMGTSDDELFVHLGSDPERVLEIAVDYMNLGLYRDALNLLSRDYPKHSPDEAEPGTVLPQEHVLIAYYRAYCRDKLGESGNADYRAASRMSTRYVFPNRPTTLTILKQAIARNPDDATAHFLLGSLRLSAGVVDSAIAEWQTARRLDPGIPVLHRNLGQTLLVLKGDEQGAVNVLREGLKADPANVEVYKGLTQAMSILGRPAADRADVLERYPDRTNMPTSLALDLALTYAEVGRFDDAERLFHNRHFEKEEGGANVGEVYAEVRLKEALAKHTAMPHFPGKVKDLDFASGDAILRGPRFEYYQGLIAKQQGKPDEARQHFARASAGKGVFAVLAAREQGVPDWKQQAERLLNGHALDRGLALAALSRNEEAREVLREVLRAPDRNLSHYLARQALK